MAVHRKPFASVCIKSGCAAVRLDTEIAIVGVSYVVNTILDLPVRVRIHRNSTRAIRPSSAEAV
jgi:hypothetical protein